MPRVLCSMFAAGVVLRRCMQSKCRASAAMNAEKMKHIWERTRDIMGMAPS